MVNLISKGKKLCPCSPRPPKFPFSRSPAYKGCDVTDRTQVLNPAARVRPATRPVHTLHTYYIIHVHCVVVVVLPFRSVGDVAGRVMHFLHFRLEKWGGRNIVENSFFSQK